MAHVNGPRYNPLGMAHSLRQNRRRFSATEVAVTAACFIILIAVVRADGAFRLEYPDGPWARLSAEWRRAPFEGVLLLATVARILLRIPVVQLRLLADHLAALWPAAAMMAFLGGAWLVEIKGPMKRPAAVLLDWSGLLLGIALLLWLLRLGPGEWGLGYDWEKDWVYYSAVKQAVHGHTLPYYLRTAVQGTERYLSNLETPWAPHVVLLGLMSPGSFFNLHVAACFSLGYVAIVKLRRAVSLSPFWWACFVVLFVLNGNITSHLGIGHTQWTGYFLLPWVFLGVIRARADTSWDNVLILALTLSAMIAIGGWHVFVWSYLFVLVFCALDRSRLLFLAGVSVAAGLLSAFRLLPALVTFGVGTNEFAGSYASVAQLLAALTGGSLEGLRRHEYDMFVGWLGFAVLCVGVLSPGLGKREPAGAVWVPSVVMITLSLFDVYRHTLFRLPGFVSERVVTRIAIVGVMGLVLIGCARLSRTAAAGVTRPMLPALASLTAALFLGLQLGLHAEGFRPAPVASQLVSDVLKPADVEPAYFWSVWLGTAVSVMAAAAILWMRFSRARRPAGPD